MSDHPRRDRVVGLVHRIDDREMAASWQFGILDARKFTQPINRI
jgi:hypothetical protein